MDIQNKAEEKLNQAYKEVLQKPVNIAPQKDLIDRVINSNHLTFKYIMFTSILSKSADSSINPLALQSGSSLTGAYNARDVCHKVIVPFEQTKLDKVMGGSNEPFLNKPARYPELSKSNPVRAGKDKELLIQLVDELPKMSTSKIAFSNLKYLLTKLLQKKQEQQQINQFEVSDSENLPVKLKRFINFVVRESFEGESVTLMVAALYAQLFQQEEARVEVHPVNQSGASTKEVSDLDIYWDENLIISNEIKDKPYTLADVRHAVEKVIKSKGNRMLFIEGPRGKLKDDDITSLVQEYGAKNFHLEVVRFNSFIDLIISVIPIIDIDKMLHYILEIAKDKKFKTEIISYIRRIADQTFEVQ